MGGFVGLVHMSRRTRRALIGGCLLLPVLGVVLLARRPPKAVSDAVDTVVRVANLTRNCSVKGELDRLCAHYTSAEKDLLAGRKKCIDVHDSFVECNGEVAKSHAGLWGLAREARYEFLLRFARKDFGLSDWECPALERLYETMDCF